MRGRIESLCSCGRSSVVEHHVANVRVVSSNLIARYYIWCPMQEFQNDLVRFQVHQRPQCIVEYEVWATAPLVLEAQKRAQREVGKDVVVPGFRKGKAPLEVVAKRFPHELDKRWQQAIADGCYRQCAEIAKIPLLRADTTISFKMHTHSGEGAHVTLSFETVPQVPEIDPKGFQPKTVDRTEVTQEKVTEAIRQIRFFLAQWSEISDRPVQEGDYILLDLESLETDPPTRVFIDTRFEVRDAQMAKWMKDLVLGKQVGDVIEGTSRPDADLPEEKKAEFEPRKVRITLKKIEAAQLPEIDENLAKQLGLHKADEIEARIQAILTKIVDQDVKDKEREQVTEFLANLNFELPRSLIEREAQFRLQQMMRDPEFKNQWEAQNSDKKREYIAGLLRESERAVRVFYLCRTLTAKEKLAITASDLQPLPTDLLEAMLNPSAQMHDPRTPEIKQAEAYSRLMLEKTADWIISRAVAQ